MKLRFKPSLAGTIALLLGLPLLLSLGAWQLRRAAEKQALLAQFAAGSQATKQLSAESVDSQPLYQSVSAYGAYDSQHQVLLDNMPSSRHVDNSGRASGGFPGYQVLTPLHIRDDYIVLVNRGWVPLGPSRDVLPDIRVDAQARTLIGRTSDLQQPGLRLSGGNDAGTWPQVLNYPTWEQLRALYGKTLLTRVILLDPDAADGYERDWSNRITFGDFGPERHRGYAVQWFGLAAALFIFFVVVSCKRHE